MAVDRKNDGQMAVKLRKFLRVYRSGENRKSKKLTDSAEGQQEANVVEVKIPTCYQQVIRSRETSEWCDAMDREINVKIER
ncbi:hypothetical protein AVEN_134522-1 [Araneus ventricosus]|uniref:Uncharacterized protein n=1 Tax=Araneus ventricosus TaxID=182803 RepID=A0A4Y2J2M2_ARAVE|nr:hypothetical protein AVEN_134522-1 [Araneus ventricosus]